MNEWWSGLTEQTQGLAIAGAIVAGAAIVGLIAAGILRFVLARLAKRADYLITDRFVARLKWPARILLPLLAVQAALPTAGLSDQTEGAIRHAIWIGFIAGLTWLALAMLSGVEGVILRRHDIRAADNLRARRVHTQMRVLTRTADILVVIVGAALVLMSFPEVRQLGASLLASAGLAGLIVGLAARPLVSNLLAGLQIALTEPIRIDDVLIVEGEWGRVEQITSTYVVVKIWDERRLIVPLTYFLEQPFQNWTRSSSDLLGTVFLHLDYYAPLDDMRAELERLCKADENWDQRLALIQVTEATERTMTVRALVSAADASKLWNLRCAVREGLIAWLRNNHPDALPREREEKVEGPSAARDQSDRSGAPRAQRDNPGDD